MFWYVKNPQLNVTHYFCNFFHFLQIFFNQEYYPANIFILLCKTTIVLTRPIYLKIKVQNFFCRLLHQLKKLLSITCRRADN